MKKKFKMQKTQQKRKVYIIVVCHKKDAIAKNHFAKKSIANALIQTYYVHRHASASVVKIYKKMNKKINRVKRYLLNIN